MNRTKIEWVKNPDGTQGYTWNPITGCLNGCPYCYARKLANGRLRKRYLANGNFAPYKPEFRKELYVATDPFYPRFWESRLKEPGNHCKTAGIFVCDMSDLFGIGIPEEWTQRVLNEIGADASMTYVKPHRFYLLTKQPQNLVKFSPFPDNCWVGVTATNYQMSVSAASWLQQVKARIKYISFEPLLDRASLTPGSYLMSGINWLIIGAQTKPYKPPKIEWVEEIVRAADQAGIPVFLKDNLYPLFSVETQEQATNLCRDYPWAFREDKFSGETEAIKYQGRAISLRQEMPKCLSC